MNKLAKSLLIGLLEDESKVIALYGGGFKPPTKGHFEVVKKTLQDHPEITKFYIVIGSGVRNGITQKESKTIWEIYKPYLSDKIEIVEAQSPLKYISNFSKENPDIKTYVVIGTREGDEDDAKDFMQRKEFFEKSEDNIKVLQITTGGGVSGTKARKFAGDSKEEFFKYLPTEITDEEREEIYNIVSPVLKENQSTQENFDYAPYLKSLVSYMIDQGLEIQPLPKVKFITRDVENASDFFGKTAYYDPENQTITLYTYGRLPKDILRSFSHEMIHHKQKLEGKIGGGVIKTTNIHDDPFLKEMEEEAFLTGNMMFRGWSDSENPHKIDITLHENVEEPTQDDILSYPSTFKPGLNITVVFKENEYYPELKSLFDEYGYGFYSPENKMIILDGEVFINSDLNFNDLKFVEAHEVSHLLLNHTGPYSEDDEMDADLGAYLLLKKYNLPTDKLEKEFKNRHGVDFDESLLGRVKDML